MESLGLFKNKTSAFKLLPSVQFLVGGFFMWALLFVGVLVGSSSWAQQQSNGQQNAGGPLSGGREFCSDADEWHPKGRAGCMNDVLQRSFGGVDECRTARESFNKALTSFGTACSTAGMTGGAGLSDASTDVHCSGEVRACLEGCDEFAFEEDEIDAYQDEYRSRKCHLLARRGPSEEDESFIGRTAREVTSTGANLNNLDFTKMTPNPRNATIDAAKLRYASCAPVASGELKDLKENFRDSRDRIRDLEQQVRDQQAKVNEVQLKIKEIKAEALTKKEEIEQELNARYEEAQELLDKQNERLLQQIKEYEQAIREAQRQIHAYSLQEAQALGERNNKLNEIRRDCLRQATESLQKLRQMRTDAIRSGTYSVGSQQQLYAAAGESLKQKEQRYVRDLTDECYNGEAGRMVRDSIEQEHQHVVAAINAGRKQAQEMIQLAQQEIKQLQTIGAQQALIKYEKAIARIIDWAERTWKAHYRQFRSQMESAMAEKQSAEQDLIARQGHLNEERIEHQEAQEIYQFARRAAGGAERPADAYDKVISAFTEAKSTAQSYVGACAAECCGGQCGAAWRLAYDQDSPACGNEPPRGLASEVAQ